MEMACIETLFQEKLMRYRELAALLAQEKKEIVAADVAALWKMSEKKQAVVAAIEKNRDRILKTATAMNIDHGMTLKNFQAFRFISLLPADQGRRLGDMAASLLTLKKEIRNISLESKQYIESKLGMIDELMAVMTGRSRQGRGYGEISASNSFGRSMLLRREV